MTIAIIIAAIWISYGIAGAYIGLRWYNKRVGDKQPKMHWSDWTLLILILFGPINLLMVFRTVLRQTEPLA